MLKLERAMSEVLLCNQPLSHKLTRSMCGIDTSVVYDLACSQPSILSPYTPYVFNSAPNALDKYLLASLSDVTLARELTNTSLSFGEDNTMALAEILKTLQEHNISAAGVSTSIYANRVDGFVGAVQEYQQSLMDYRAAVKADSPSKLQAKQKAFQSFESLQYRFRNELAAVNAQVKSRRGTPLTSATRATNIAKDSRHVAKLNVSSQVEANNLVKFSQNAKFLGGGLAVIDFGSRVGSVHNSYVADENWERELFIESLSFAASAATAYAATGIGSSALGFLVVATPVGWVGLVVGGLLVAGAVGAASIYANNKTKENSGKVYDEIMNWMEGL